MNESKRAMVREEFPVTGIVYRVISKINNLFEKRRANMSLLIQFNLVAIVDRKIVGKAQVSSKYLADDGALRHPDSSDNPRS